METENEATNGTELKGGTDKIPEGTDVTTIEDYVQLDEEPLDLVCGFLRAYGNAYDVIVTAERAGCFTWVFSRGGSVTSMQTIWIPAGQQRRGYTTDGRTTVGISCQC